MSLTQLLYHCFFQMFCSLWQAVMITVWTVEVLDSARNASLPTPRCTASVCSNVAGTTSWMHLPKLANVRIYIFFLFYFYM